MLELDHLAIAANSLAEGREAVETALGVTLQPGGQHAHFATHNLLLGLEDGFYLEVIAADPSVPSPPYARWFDLDRFSGAPRLSNWICRSDDLNVTLENLPQAGQPVALSRGSLKWQMAVPKDGILPFDNHFPALMQWQCRDHPAEMLRPSGCRLLMLTVSHPEAERLATTLVPYLNDARLRFEAGPQGLSAEIETPAGARILE